jgi:porin
MLARVFAGLAALACATNCTAQWLERWADQETMTGDWGGARMRWRDAGVSVFATWGVNLAGNPVGGLSQEVTYVDDQSWGFDFDLDRLAKLRGTAVRLSFNNRDGQNLSANALGALFAVQQLYGGGEIPRLMEFAISQDFLDGRLNVRAGRVMGAADFATSPLYCEFMNQSICGNLGNLGKNIVFSFYPVASWGGRVQWKPNDKILVQAGVFESNPTLTEKNGFDWSTSGAIGTVTIGEVWYIRGGSGEKPGHYKLGAYYSSADAPDLYFDANGGSYVQSGLPPVNHSGKSGVYFLADQAVTREPAAGNQGLTALGGLSFASETTNFMPFLFFVGLQYTGLIEGRPDDILGFSATQGRVSSNLANTQRLEGQPPQKAETLFELNYSMRLTNWFVFEPNFQYVLTPGGTGTIPNAFVLGLQTTLTF